MKRTRMLPVLVALSVPALTAAQTPAPPVRTRPQLENAANPSDAQQQGCAPSAVLIAPAMPLRIAGATRDGKYMWTRCASRSTARFRITRRTRSSKRIAAISSSA